MTKETSRIQDKSHTEDRRTIPVIPTIKKEKSPLKGKGQIDTYYVPYKDNQGQGTKMYRFMSLEEIPTTKEDFRKKEKERFDKHTSPFDEKERADERFKTLKTTLTTQIKGRVRIIKFR